MRCEISARILSSLPVHSCHSQLGEVAARGAPRMGQSTDTVYSSTQQGLMQVQECFLLFHFNDPKRQPGESGCFPFFHHQKSLPDFSKPHHLLLPKYRYPSTLATGTLCSEHRQQEQDPCSSSSWIAPAVGLPAIIQGHLPCERWAKGKVFALSRANICPESTCLDHTTSVPCRVPKISAEISHKAKA
jgi:hypothetical protein